MMLADGKTEAWRAAAIGHGAGAGPEGVDTSLDLAAPLALAAAFDAGVLAEGAFFCLLPLISFASSGRLLLNLGCSNASVPLGAS